MEQDNRGTLMLMLCSLVFPITGCGGSASSISAAQAPTFVNHTSASNAELMRYWQLAQMSLATQSFILNDADVLDRQAIPDVHSADPRAMSVQPDGLVVTALPDVPTADLPLSYQQGGGDPSGLISFFPFIKGNDLYVEGYTTWGNGPPAVFVAASKATNTYVMVYEFENVILSRLGYDVNGR